MSDNLVSIACLTGFFGDALLQFGSKFGSGWGLKPYFKQHGSIESLFVATGMMGLFYAIYFTILGLPAVWYYLALYGIVLDLIFRETRLFPSLDGYYKALNYFWSGFWGAVPLMMPFYIAKFITKIRMNM